MIKEILIASVQKAIVKQSEITQDSIKLVHPQVVSDEIAKVYSQIIKTFYSSNVNLVSSDLSYYSKKYDQPVKKTDAGVFYVDLPVRPIGLKNNLGVRSVKPVDGDFSFVRSSEGELETLRSLEIYRMARKAYYYHEPGKLVFDFPCAEYSLVPAVTIRLLPHFEDFDDKDNIEFPMGEMEATTMVLQAMGYRQTDNVNDDVR